MERRAGVTYRLGLVEYGDGIALMDALVPKRIEGAIPDTLCLLSHPHTITLGRRADPKNILLEPGQARAMGVGIVETGRGGDVTYHGPGQLVGYPILNLRPGRQDAHKYVRNLEEVMIRALGDYGIEAGRSPGFTGVWVGKEKIAAIGVRLKRWVTSHGFALNVNTDLKAFRWIIPCGIEDKGVTSMAALLGHAVDMEEVESRIIHHARAVFETDFEDKSDIIRPSIQTIPLRRTPRGWEALVLRRTPAKGGFWQPVTGHIEDGETPEDAAARELEEETGIKATIHALDYTHCVMIDPAIAPALPVPTFYREHGYWAEVAGAVKLDPDAHDRAEWLPISEAAQRMRWAGNQKAVAMAAALAASR